MDGKPNAIPLQNCKVKTKFEFKFENKKKSTYGCISWIHQGNLYTSVTVWFIGVNLVIFLIHQYCSRLIQKIYLKTNKKNFNLGWVLVWFMVFNASFNNISVISWWSVLLMEETGVPGDNHPPAASHRQTYHIMLNRRRGIQTKNISGDRYWLPS